MRLIDADVLKYIKFHGVTDWTPTEETSYQRGWNGAIDAIMRNAPTVDGEIDEICRIASTVRTMFAIDTAHECWEMIRNGGIELVKHGHWISHGSYFTCSVCGEEQYGIDTGRYYCPNCGAKMDEVTDD